MARPKDYALKLIRAHEHLDDLYAETVWWRQAEPYRLSRERDPETNARVIYAEPVSQPPDKLALIAGDVVHNLRSCLDVLALALAEINGPVPIEIESTSQFPICSTRRNFRLSRSRQIICIEARPQAVIQRLQPYRSGENWARHPLWVLRELSDLDKHRRLPLIGAFAQVTATSIRSSDAALLHESSFSLGEVLQAKTEVARITPVGVGSDRHEVDMDVDLAMDVAFADEAPFPLAQEPLFPTLELVWRFVAQEVVGRLQPYLGVVEPIPAPTWPPGFKPKALTVRKRGEKLPE